MAVTPVTYGATSRPPRGDYSSARDDYTCDQDWHRYTDAQHQLYARLYARQRRLVQGRACDEFLGALGQLGSDQQIPRFEDVSARLRRATGWQIVAVPGLIPEEAFFRLLAHRRFPVTVWLRLPSEFDYIVEPDLFHDLFGHVPLLFDPVFADYMQAYGEGGLKAQRRNALELLSRLYWYTVEFGLIDTVQGLRVYGAGILSSPGEIDHALTNPGALRIGFDLRRVLRTIYEIDDFQKTYFVIDSFAQLFEQTAQDFTPIYEQVRRLPACRPDRAEPGERLYCAVGAPPE
jgi:phenylalanine-4-hydroxylase